MSITRAQIARQLLAKGGKIGNTTFQLARKRPDGKKPGYFGPDAGEGGMESDFGQDTYSTSDVDFGGVSGGTDQQFADTRAAIEARTPKETLGQKIVNQLKNISKFSPSLNIFKGIGNLFDKFQNLRGFNPDGTRRTQAQFEQARRDRINQNRISNILGRDAPFTLQTLENLAKLGYTGPLDDSLIGSTNITRSGTADDIYPDRVEGIVSQARGNPTFRDAMAQLNLEKGVPRDQVFLRAEDFIDPSKTISSEDLGTVQQNIKDATGYDTTLARNYTKQDLEKLGAEKGFFGANDQLEALQDYYDAATKYSQSGLGQTRSPSEIRDYIDRAGGVIGLGVPNIDMDLVPKDFLETEQDFKQQKSPIELLDI
jgi:hypothetical protein